MKPGRLQKKKGSKYYSSVQVGCGLSRFVDNFPILFTAKNNFSELLLYTNENWENHLLLAYIRQFKKSRANVFPASLNYLHHFAIPVLQQPSNQKVSFPLV